MSPSSRDNKYANSGIVVAVNPQDIPEYSASGIMAVLDFVSDMEKRAWEAGGCRQSAPAARMTDFCTKKTPHTLNDTSYQPGITPSDLDYVLGGFVAPRLRDGLVAFGRKMRGFYTEQANLIGVETRTSSPLTARCCEFVASPGIGTFSVRRRRRICRRYSVSGYRWRELCACRGELPERECLNIVFSCVCRRCTTLPCNPFMLDLRFSD